ncbi:MarR family winged helix-turn-helix transcriptional regulator [Alkalicoccus chagannorensis]|uniref:MarR family winged helix-turn-helix transcriptional regulator n=1 Tax=Alkalicoccus chagannorensis TaxID=427072 RepID=UPI00041C140C|nr:MarR family transcriptional regulator [Alkalicoccus chagannorensis]
MEERTLDDRIGAQLGMTAHLMENHVNKTLAAHGLTNAQLRVLFLLQRYGEQTQKQLQERLHIQASTMNGLTASLEKRELIIKQAGKKDRRSSWVRLTGEGSAKEAALWRETEQLEEHLTDGLDDAERKQLLSALQRMQQKLKEG